MVMKKNAMRKNLRQSILKSFGRYIAIVAIIALGSALFVGLLMTKTDMVATGQKFIDEQNMFDLRMMCSYGWTEEYVEKMARLDGVEDAEGVIYLDLVARRGEVEDDAVYRFYAIPETVNKVALRGGRMPVAADECLACGFSFDESLLGKTVTISKTNEEDSLDSVKHRTFTIVGFVATPLYMDMNRGTTTVGSGSLADIFYIPEDAFDVEYYSEINVTLTGDYRIYADEYMDALDAAIDSLEPEVEALSDARFADVKGEAEDEYNDGYQEYLDGIKEYEDGKAEAEQELADAYDELVDAEEKLADSRQELVENGQKIKDGRAALDAKKKELQEQEKSMKSYLQQVRDGIAQAEGYLEQFTAGLAAQGMTVEGLKSAIDTLKTNIAELEGQLSQYKDGLAAAGMTEEQIAADETVITLSTTITELAAQKQTLEATYTQYTELTSQIASLKSQAKQLEDGLAQIADGYAEIERQGWILDDAYDQLMVGWGLYHEGEAEIADGWAEYEDAKLDVEEELAEAEADLKEAEEELADAREEIDSLDPPEYFILDRTSNVGYNNLESSSDIVQGVSRVIPVFFILVASLVCITTMTRMIDEERTQIGTLKALGYSNAAIIGKYLMYSGSGAIIGCGMGVLVGSAIFPMILWKAYCIMLYIQPNIVLTLNWALCISVVLMYTGVMLIVTWYCCHRTLEEEPAELIRPKSPDAGKKILMEYLPFWHKISFLNKVTIRNIFRYRQRLAMMMVGIGGCTALLVTGFGLRDSIMNVVDYQFEEVSLYDMEVYFNEGLTEKERDTFLTKIGDEAKNIMFFHQSSVDLDFGGKTKEIYMIAAGEELREFMDLHKDEEPLSLPSTDEVVVSAGVAENLGIAVGDSVTLRNADMQSMVLTVSGVYDNHVYNYAIVSPQTVQTQWGTEPEQQMAFVQIAEGQDVHMLGADISEMSNVMNVTISEDVAEMVGGMLEALDLVVIVIVFCAGLLAVIVLYNLTNININERIREIATIKVLGFNASETGAYVFKENLTLTVAGSVFGLLLGYLMLLFVMSQIKIDMVWFKALVEPKSYLWSIALTLLSAIVVDFIFYFKLDKINMAEALKSVE